MKIPLSSSVMALRRVSRRGGMAVMVEYLQVKDGVGFENYDIR